MHILISNFKGVIFDLDGTLVDSLEDIADSMNTVLKSRNYPTHEFQTYKHLIGNGVRNLVREALPEDRQDEEIITGCFQSMIEVYRKSCLNKTKPYDGITDLLNELVSWNIKMAVLSNKADDLTKKIVSTLLPDWNFESVTGLTSEAHKKPDPQEALVISKRMGISPGNIIYMGDSGIDMQTAKNAGMYAAGVLWGFRTKDELLLNGAQYLLNHPMDLIDIL